LDRLLELIECPLEVAGRQEVDPLTLDDLTRERPGSIEWKWLILSYCGLARCKSTPVSAAAALKSSVSDRSLSLEKVVRRLKRAGF